MAISLQAVRDEFLIASCPEEIAEIQERILDTLTASGFGQRELFAVQLAVEEALVNAMKHGNADDSSKETRIALEIDDEWLSIEVEDQGDGFSLDDVADPTLPENLDRPCGRGIMLMHSFMTSVKYNERGNRVTLALRR